MQHSHRPGNVDSHIGVGVVGATMHPQRGHNCVLYSEDGMLQKVALERRVGAGVHAVDDECAAGSERRVDARQTSPLHADHRGHVHLIRVANEHAVAHLYSGR